MLFGTNPPRGLLDHVDEEAALLVLAMSDELALGALDVLRAAGHTSRAAGWDATPAGLAAGITSVTNPLRHQGRRCAQAVLEGTAGGDDDVLWEVVAPAPG